MLSQRGVSGHCAQVLTMAETSYEGSAGACSPAHVLIGRIQFLKLKASASHWLLAEGLPQFLARRVSP